MTTNPTPPTFGVRQAMHVHAHGAWRSGTVTAVNSTRLTVSYRLADAEPSREWMFPTSVVRPAAGVRLVRVDQLRPGDRVVQFDGRVTTVDGIWPVPPRRCLLTYTDGESVSLTAATILRVTTIGR